MTIALEEVARTLRISPEKLWYESLRAYIDREKRVTNLDIADIQERYQVSNPQELVQGIETGKIYSHPAWEDLIEWENLLAHLERLDQLESTLSQDV